MIKAEAAAKEEVIIVPPEPPTSPKNLDYVFTLFSWEFKDDSQLDVIKELGFNTISTEFRYGYLGTPQQEEVLGLIAKIKERGFKLLLRLVLDARPTELPICDRVGRTGAGLNVFSPDAVPLMRYFAGEVKKLGLVSKADMISLAWSESFEIDSMSWGKIPFERTKAANYEFGMAGRRLINQAIGTLGAICPIGGQRGSLWHIKELRHVSKLAQREKSFFLADAYPPYSQQLELSCQLAKELVKTGGKIFNEFDDNGAKLGGMLPENFDAEYLKSMEILAANGISGGMVHLDWATLEEKKSALKKAAEYFR